MDQVIVFNPRNGAHITKFLWAGGNWGELPVNSMKKYPSHVAEEMLRRFGFLIKVRPEDVANMVKEMNAQHYQCPFCEFETTDKQKLALHQQKTHKLDEGTKQLLKDIPEATQAKSGLAEQPRTKLTIDEQEGIPKGEAMDKDKIPWYGAGLEDDTPDSGMMKRVLPGKEKGSFGAS